MRKIINILQATLAKEASPISHIQFLRYIIVAVVSLIIDFGVLVFFVEVLNFNYLLSASLGFMGGLIVNFKLSVLWVFPKRNGSVKAEFIIYGIIGLVGLGLTDLIMWILTGVIGYRYIASKLLATILVFLWNFTARKKILYGLTKAEQ